MSPIAAKLRVAAALLAAATTVTGQNDSTVGTGASAAGPTWNHADYETSPPVYPSPNATGLGWEDAFQQASDFVGELTLEEKVRLVTGTPGPCVGNIGPIKRLGFNGLCLQDGPLAIREATFASVFPAGLSVAASWDKDLARQRGVDMALEFKGKGSHIALGPVAGPLGRSGYGGRNWEGFSPDPYLTGELFGITIEGMESTGVQACAKHYIGNEQETQRNPSGGPNSAIFGGPADAPSIEAVSSNIDDRTMHEAYLWPFYNAVHSGVSSIMCSYNRINGSYGCQNSKTLNGLLKEELGFQGYVMSDWLAVHAGYPAAEAGLDMNMPGGIGFLESAPSFFGGNITTSVNNGSLPIERLDDMCRRIMTPYFRLGQDKNYPPIDASSGALNFFPTANYLYNFTYGPSNVDVRDDHKNIIREIGAAGSVLLKNVNNTLPLKTPSNVGVFGNDASDISVGLYFGGVPFLSNSNTGYDQGVLPVGGGSGTGRMTYVVAPLEAIKSKVFSYNDKALVQYVTNNSEIVVNGIFGPLINPTPPEVCLVFLKTWAGEGADRTSLQVDWDGNAVVEEVAASCPNTVVITNSAGLNTLPWANNPNVTGIIAAHLQGQEVGNAIVDILWGAVNPSGKLPYTIALEEDDYAFADITNSTELLETTDQYAWQSDFEERLLIDYRHFDFFNESVQYEFGFGLSYTTFSMGAASVTRVGSGSITAAPGNNTIQPGGNPALWDVLYSVSVSVSNTGDIAGATVPQLYLGLPQPANEDYTPVKVLRGFEKVMLSPGESQTVTFDLTRRDISYWDTFSQQWIIGSSAIGVLAGFSSRDIQATTTFSPLSSSSGGSGGSGGSVSSSASPTSGSGSPTTTTASSYGDHAGPWHWSNNQGHKSQGSHWGPPAKQ
ncbi:hypothetical protein LTR10_003648 [Elasticomyces elasticus]|nr:hypothetical protein LTR10_003648 [Elasticomyces elasticus]KAK4978160.1 hypothetical protein LTR42_002537 [Elasticomyces elasticus]